LVYTLTLLLFKVANVSAHSKLGFLASSKSNWFKLPSPASTPKPKGRYEDAVINTKSPSTKTAAIPRSSAKARKPDPKGKIAMFADALSRGAENMMKKNGGAVKSKKKK